MITQTPAIADAGKAVDDQGIDIELSEPRGDAEARLPTADE